MVVVIGWLFLICIGFFGWMIVHDHGNLQDKMKLDPTMRRKNYFTTAKPYEKFGQPELKDRIPH